VDPACRGVEGEVVVAVVGRLVVLPCDGIAAQVAQQQRPDTAVRPHQALANRTPMAVWRDGVAGARGPHVFGLLTLLGFRFAPRLRELKDRRLYAFHGQKVPAVFTNMLGGTVDADHVRTHWDDAFRLAVSIQSGHATASDMLRRLAAYPRQNGLAVALREIGRIERKLFTLITG
jgi:Tn3 transposase DDE domain